MKETVDFSKLTDAAVSGDNAAFEELYRLTHKTAYHTASLLLNNPDDIEDVLQNSYIKAYQKLSELKNPESFESWIKSIVENECKNYIKKEKRISAPVIFFRNKADENSEEWKQPVPQEYMEREELRKSVTEILNKLSPEVRACIVLFHYEDKSLNEISELLDIPLGTVKSRLYKGRKKIEKEFGKLKKEDPTLYGVTAIPVILSLLSYQSKNISVPAAISESIMSSASTAAASGTATASTVAATTSTAVSGSVAATSIAVKIAAAAVAGSVAIGGSVAIKNHVEKKTDAETTTSYSSAFSVKESEGTCTVTELTTEFTTHTEASAEMSSVSVSKSSSTSTATIPATTQSATESTTESTSESEDTTKRQTTTKLSKTTTSTTKQTTLTTQTTTTTTAATATTTSAAPVTTEETTTERTTTATTAPPTTNPENNYGTSGGVITEYMGTDSSISIPATIDSETVTAIGAGAFAGNTDIESVNLPSSVTQIGQEAFADCTSLSSVSLPSSLELLGIGAFYGCSSLSSVTIPDGTKTISDEAFAQCTSLSTVTIPPSVTSIADDAFDGCDSLTIRCEEGSAAHDFAVANNINFSLM